MKNILIILFVLLYGCGTHNKQSDKIVSPSKNYYLTTTVNDSDKLKANYGAVVINLFSASGDLKSTLNTNASDFSKWAVGWDKKNDTVILFSSDIGTYAWEIKGDSLVIIDLTDEIKQEAKDLKLKKYGHTR